jgi:hypothetical protein
MNIAVKYQDRVDTSMFLPQVNWRNARNRRTKTLPTAAIAAVESKS